MRTAVPDLERAVFVTLAFALYASGDFSPFVALAAGFALGLTMAHGNGNGGGRRR